MSGISDENAIVLSMKIDNVRERLTGAADSYAAYIVLQAFTGGWEDPRIQALAWIRYFAIPTLRGCPGDALRALEFSFESMVRVFGDPEWPKEPRNVAQVRLVAACQELHAKWVVASRKEDAKLDELERAIRRLRAR